MNQERWKDFIRSVPDFPKEGIVFRDITTLLSSSKNFSRAIEALGEPYRNEKVNAVVAVEARGFIFGGAIAARLNAAFVPVRKKGKLPFKTYQATYELEYGTDTLEIHRDAFASGSRILIVDDLLATGGTTAAVIELVKKLGGEIAGITFLIELEFLKGRERLKGYPVFSLIKYDTE